MRDFRQFLAHLTKCNACQGICTLSPLHAALTLRFAQNEPQDTSKVLHLPRKITMMVSKVLRLPGKNATHLLKTSQKYCGCAHKTTFHKSRNTSECHEVPRLPRTRNAATRQLKLPKMTPLAELTIGMAWHGHTALNGCERLRTVADGCRRLRTVAVVNAASSEHTLTQTPRVKR